MRHAQLLYRGQPTPLAMLIGRLTELSAEETELLIQMGGAYVGNRRCKRADYIVQNGDQISAYWRLPLRMDPVAFDPNWIIEDNGRFLVAAKPAGAPTQGRRDADYMAFYELLKQNLAGYVGLHHRLDQDASGAMIFSRDRTINRDMARIFSEKLIEKTYMTVAVGDWPFPRADALIDAPIGPQRTPSGTRHAIDPRGKPAQTRIRLLSRAEGLLLLEVKPMTGRTHQIRVHLSAQNMPLLGDALYGGPGEPGFFLHCLRLTWPRTGALPAGDWRAPTPPRWRSELPCSFQAFLDEATEEPATAEASGHEVGRTGAQNRGGAAC